MASRCPRCGNPRNEGALECPACGIVYDRYRPPVTPPPATFATPAPVVADPLPSAWGPGAANPYAAPASRVADPSGPPAAAAGVWRSGRLLVAWKGAALPYRCVVCNGRADLRLPRKMYWHPPLVYLLVLINLLIYLIVALVVRKRADVDVPLCQEHESRRKRGVLAVALMIPGAIVGLISGIGLLASNGGSVGAVLVLACPVLLVGAVFVSSRTRAVVPKKIDDRYVWLTGASPAYLAALPPIPE